MTWQISLRIGLHQRTTFLAALWAGRPNAAKIFERRHLNKFFLMHLKWKAYGIRNYQDVWSSAQDHTPNSHSFQRLINGTCGWSEHGDVEVVDWSDAKAGGPIHFFPEISPTAADSPWWKRPTMFRTWPTDEQSSYRLRRAKSAPTPQPKTSNRRTGIPQNGNLNRKTTENIVMIHHGFRGALVSDFRCIMIYP